MDAWLDQCKLIPTSEKSVQYTHVWEGRIFSCKLIYTIFVTYHTVKL